MRAVTSLLIVTCSLFDIILQTTACAGDCGNYSITFNRSIFDGTDTMFLNDVQVCCGKLAHWVLEMPACVTESTVKDAGTVSGGSDWDWKDLDGATQLRGVMLKTDAVHVSGEFIATIFHACLEGN